MTDVNVTNLNFNEIRDSIKSYLKTQDTFKDYNFEGSVLATIINTLAYNTYLNAYYTNMASNEGFLDTAQIRQNIVSNAKKLGYTPRSRRCSVAQLELQFFPFDTPDTIVIPRYAKFTATLNSVNYTFITNQEYTVHSDNGVYRKIIDVFEGTSYTYTYTYDGSNEFFKILDNKIDTTTLEVYVKPNTSSTNRTEFTKINDITIINSETNGYFLQESYDSKYEIYFGDGILGKALTIGNVVEITGIVTSGVDANNIRKFDAYGILGYNADNISTTYAPTISLVSQALGGQEQESIKSVRFSAPKRYSAQKRLVTGPDYENYLLSEYSDIQAVSVWGGERNDPPLYGKIVCSIKPENSFVLSNFKKNEIINNFGNRNVMAIDPVIIDPVFTFIKPTVVVYYDSRKTTLNSEGILNKVSNSIKTFENDVLSKFKQSFYESKFTSIIDSSDPSIVNNATEIVLEKRFAPIYNSTYTYKVKFNGSLKNPYSGYRGCLNSTGFKLVNSSQDYFQFFDDDGQGNINIYRFEENERKYTMMNVGTIDYVDGSIILKGMNFAEIENSSEEIKLFVEPYQTTYTPVRNEILLLSSPFITVVDNSKQIVTSVGIVDVIGNDSPIVDNSLLNTVVI